MVKNKKNTSNVKKSSGRTSSAQSPKSQGSFRRGQTISGYRKEDSQRSKAHDLIVKRRKISSFLMFLLAGAALILFVLSQLVVKIDFYSQDGKMIEDQSRYQKVIDEYYQDRPIERMRIFLNGDNLLSAIQSELPEVAAIDDINLKSFTHFKFVLNMRKPVASWSVNDKNYFVDNTGVAFNVNYYDNPSITISDESGIKIGDNHIVVSNGFLSFVGKIIGAANTNNLEVERIVIPPSSLRQVEVYVKNVSYPAIFLTSSSAEAQVKSLSRAVRYFQTNGLSPQYVDLRVEGKAFYKL